MKVNRYNYSSHFSDSEFEELSGDILSVIKSGDYILSEHVSRFEQEFARYNSARYCVGCNSGTDALVLALTALNIGQGDEVVIPANTFHATALAIAKVGATPVLVEPDSKSFLINPDLISVSITAKTKAILLVHLYGAACDMDAIIKICSEHGLRLIEDCAQAHGARYKGQPVGIFGSVGCFSFHPSKNLPAAGDAGACITNSEELFERMKLLRHFGQKEQNYHSILGMNSRLDSIQSIILSRRLEKLTDWNTERLNFSKMYLDRLRELPIDFQVVDYDSYHVYHLFQVNVGAEKRDKLLNFLLIRGIDAVVRYPIPIHLQDSFRYLGYREGHFPLAEELCKSLLCLPVSPFLTPEQIDYVVSAVKEFYQDDLRGRL